MKLYNDRNQTKSQTNQQQKNAIKLARVGIRYFASIPHHKQITNKSLTTFGSLVGWFLGWSVSSRISKSNTRNVAKQMRFRSLLGPSPTTLLVVRGMRKAPCAAKRCATRFDCTPSLRPQHTIRGDDAGQRHPFTTAPPRDHYGQTTYLNPRSPFSPHSAQDRTSQESF